jgi:hypothetical protein
MAFEEVVAGPLKVYIAPFGTAFPTLNEEPDASWTLIGTNGDMNYSEEGVTVSHSATYNKTRTAGAAGPIKAHLDNEDLMIRLTLIDITEEQYAVALNNQTVNATAAGVGTMGQTKMGLSRGVRPVAEFALVARGLSPKDETLPMQYCIPRCINESSPEVVHRKGVGAALALQLAALEDPSAASEQERFGYREVGTAPALP